MIRIGFEQFVAGVCINLKRLSEKVKITKVTLDHLKWSLRVE